MIRMQTGRWLRLAVLLLAADATAARAEGLAIQSFDETGRLTFNELSYADSYRLEWAPSPAGPWTNFSGAAGAALDEIMAKGSGIVTCSVPMCYRVVASVTIPEGMALITGGTKSGTNLLASGEYYGDFYPQAYSLTVSSFYMDKYEVTKAKWDEVYNWAIVNGYSFDTDLYGEGPHGQGKAADHPVHTVNWYDCVKWCNARGEREGRPAVYLVDGVVYRTGQSNNVTQAAVAGYRLPTETEWQYAARGGVANRRFPWGDTYDIDHGRANYYSFWSGGVPFYSYDKAAISGDHPDYCTGELPYTSPVGSFAANGYGLYDMAGNVYEWCYEWHPVHAERVVRGGSWVSNANDCRVGVRYCHRPDGGDGSIGFRAVLPPGQP